MERGALLDTAKQTVTKDRTGHYGEPENTFQTIAEFWSTYLGIEISQTQVAMMMALLKVARQKVNPAYLDSYLDLAGYAACAAEVQGAE